MVISLQTRVYQLHITHTCTYTKTGHLCHCAQVDIGRKSYLRRSDTISHIIDRKCADVVYCSEVNMSTRFSVSGAFSHIIKIIYRVPAGF